MKFYPLGDGTGWADLDLQGQYQAGRKIGKVCLGESVFYFRSKRKVYYIPYTAIRRYFRRVMMVPAKLCCGRGDFQMEHLVICGEEGELAQIELPGTKAAKILMEELGRLAPDALVGRPAKDPAS